MNEQIKLFPVSRWPSAGRQAVTDELAVEEPLEIRLNGRPLAVIMRTPGHDIELAAGFLLSEGVIRYNQEMNICAAEDELGLEIPNVLEASLPQATEAEIVGWQRNVFANSSCGICGRASIDRIRVNAPPLQKTAAPSLALLQTLPAKLRDRQTAFAATGGLHGAMLVDRAGKILGVREDIGRHNAVDKLLGWGLLKKRLPLSGVILFVSGRLSFEITQKALVAGISCVAGISAASSLAVELAQEAGMTLVGFVRDGGAVVYAGEQRA
jgi:FdhD protein